MTPAHPAVDPPHAAAQSASASRLRVLVVDDDADSVDVMAMLLELEGHEVRTAVDGAAAVVLASDFRPDCAVLDLQMPGLDGCEVARQLRAVDGGAGLLLIAASGRDADAAPALPPGFDCRLSKPIDVDRLYALLADWQQRRVGRASG